MLELRLLGQFEVWRDGVRLEPVWPRRHARDVLQLLALQPQMRLHKEQVIEAIWPDEDAEKRLYYVLHALRKVLEPTLSQPSQSRYVSYKEGFLELHDVWVDVKAFEEKLSQETHAKHLEETLELYRGNLLSDSLYTSWLDAERERLKQRYMVALGQLLDVYQGDTEKTPLLLERLLAAEPSEVHYRKLTEYYLQQGNNHEAARQYQRCLEFLKDIETEPEAETQGLFETLHQQQLSPTLPVTVSSFPLLSTPLLGRDKELREVGKLLSKGTRLVTLTGSAGVGKTRLALELASSLQANFNHGVVTLSLAALQAPELLVPALRHGLGVSGDVAQYLKEKNLLLVLDNCEHLPDALPYIGTLLESAPLLSVLATSRTPLHLRGETCVEVLPLDKQSATELFVTRVKAVHPQTVLSAKERSEIASLCKDLDALPLAIELAASHAPLGIAAIRRKLQERLDFQHSERNAPERHRSLRAALEWSFALLPEASQEVFRTVGVFAGRFDLALLEAVSPHTTLGSLSALLDYHLVFAIKTGEGTQAERIQFDCLETVRIYAAELLAASPVKNKVHQCHADYFLQLVEEAEKHRSDAQQKEYLDELEASYPEIRAALEYVFEADPNRALRFVMSLGHFWYFRNYYAEGKQWHEKVLPFASTDETRYGVYRGMAGLSHAEGNIRESKQYIEQCLLLPYVTGEARRHAATLSNVAMLSAGLEGLVAAKPLYEKVLALLEFDDEPPALGIKGTALYNLGSKLVEDGQWHEAEEVLEKALEIYQKQHFEQGTAHALSALATIALERKEFDLAEALAGRSLELCQRLNYQSLEAAVWLRLGHIELARHEPDSAIEKLLRGLELAKQSDTTTFANALLTLSAWGAAKHDDYWATQLLSLAQHLQSETGKQFPHHPSALYPVTKDILEQRLGENAFKTAWRLGASQKLEDILAKLPNFAEVPSSVVAQAVAVRGRY
jgi:predicted ATPase/DNA-binding SARP family transcriptional activator